MVDPAPWLTLTAAQRGLFFAHQIAPDNPCYSTAEVVEVAGRLDPQRIRGAVADAYAEFEQLRVEFALTPDGPRQRVRTPAAVELSVVDVAGPAEAERWLREDLARPFDLLAGELTRTGILRLPEVDWWWHAAHHVVLDGYGVQQLLRRTAELYRGAERAPVRVGLAELIDSEPLSSTEAEAVWDARLATYDGPASLAGHAAGPAPAALRSAVSVPPDLQRALVVGAKRLGVAWSDLVTAALGSYLARMADQPSIRIGLPLMNRMQPGVGALPAAHTVCTAMNVLPVTIDASGTVAQTLTGLAEEQTAIREHPWVRQEDLTRRLGARGQLFGAQINIIPFDLEVDLGAVGTVRNLTAGPVEDLTLGLRGVPGRGREVRLELDANPALFPADEIEPHLARILVWLEHWADASGDDIVAAMPVMTASERTQVTQDFNATEHPHAAATLGRRFVDAAERHPEAIALRFADQTRTYRDLVTRARQIAGGLAVAGIGPGAVVGVRQHRGFGLYETIHALALLGAVYLPVDPDLPEDRIVMMLADAGAALVVTDPEEWISDGATYEGTHVHVEAPAYLLFTSGSTGRPKGVLVGHRAIDNRLAWMQHHLPLEPGDVVLHKTPISFDVSIWELFWPLQVGACVEIAPPGAHRDPRELAPLLENVDVVHFVPSMLRAFLADRVAREQVRDAGGVRHLVTSGEALTPDLVEGAVQWFGVAPTNLYGPTEAAVDVTVWDTDPAEALVPIGRPIWNTTCFVLDAARRPVPVGAVGELWLGGVQLALEYVGRPDLTTERFIHTEFGRLYRTGDLAAWRPDGALRYLGRTDDQVKVRGQRVELGEIEAVVAGLDGVVGAVAGVVEDRLICWVHLDPGPRPAEDLLARLRSEAGAVLPAAWLPSRWIPVDEIPVGPSGKADRRRLAANLGHHADAEAGRAPESLLEQRLAEALGEALGLPALSVEADFFEAGGDSLAALRALAGIADALEVDLRLADLFAQPNAAGLARLIEAGDRVDGFAEVLTLRAGVPGRMPLILLPPAGGLGWCYTGLLAHLPADVPVHTIQAPGLEDGSPEPVASLTELAERQLAAIRTVVGDQGFHVAGWSLGGMAAHGVAALARADGQRVGAVVLLDAYPPDQWVGLAEPTEADALLGLLRLGAATLPEATELSRENVAEALRGSGSALATLPAKVIDGCIASVLEAARLVRTPLPDTLLGDATLVVATAPRPEDWLDPAGWSGAVAGSVERIEVACTHGELVRRPEVGRLLAALVE